MRLHVDGKCDYKEEMQGQDVTMCLLCYQFDCNLEAVLFGQRVVLNCRAGLGNCAERRCKVRQGGMPEAKLGSLASRIEPFGAGLCEDLARS